MSAVDALLYPSFCWVRTGPSPPSSTAVPALCVQLWDAVQADDHVEALKLHRKLLRVWNALAGDNLPANVKFCQELQGRPAGLPRCRMPQPSEEQRAKIEQALLSLQV